MTDFGVPKVVGGDYNVLAVEAYKAVVGQQNFSKGAAIGLMLLIPAVLTFLLDRRLRTRQGAGLTGRSQRYAPGRHGARDLSFLLAGGCIALMLAALVGVAVWASSSGCGPTTCRCRCAPMTSTIWMAAVGWPGATASRWRR
ncbi:hypothetical protein L539_3181 [Bordetella hinzii 5132]|nr:hypothetical protein L539_3181 [Bordetella hinzii 5132]